MPAGPPAIERPRTVGLPSRKCITIYLEYLRAKLVKTINIGSLINEEQNFCLQSVNHISVRSFVRNHNG